MFNTFLLSLVLCLLIAAYGSLWLFLLFVIYLLCAIPFLEETWD